MNWIEVTVSRALKYKVLKVLMCTVYRLFLQVNEKMTNSIPYQNNINKLHETF